MSVSAKITWYWRRLIVMPLAEIPWRIVRAVKVRVLVWHYRRALAPQANWAQCPDRRLLIAHDAAADMPAAPVDAWLRDGFPIFEEHWALDALPDWYRDPKTKTPSPHSAGLFIDYRNAQRVGDIKYLWEPARFHVCVPLAQAWRATGHPQYLDAIALQLDSFLDQCPCPQGVHWSSALESAIRLLNWALVWELTGGRESPLVAGEQGAARLQRWLEAIYWHQHFIHHYYAAWSSANNHLMGEAAGVFVASSVWPLWSESAAWQQQARQLLERECVIQNHRDGVNAEQALCYQQFVLDFLLLPLLVADRRQHAFSDAYRQRVHAMAVFLAALKDDEGGWPQIGDADEGLATGLSVDGVNANYASVLATVGVLFDDAALAQAGRWDDKNNGLLGVACRAHHAALGEQSAHPLPKAFPEGGYFHLGDRALSVWIDAGPLGLGALAAHGHADALQILLWVHGLPVLIDPGTYAYHTEPRWRDYFRGTRAHNTVAIDGLDQSVIGGNFLWLDKAHAHCTDHQTEGREQCFSGYHDGYRRLSSPVRHQRDVCMNVSDHTLQVTDRLLGAGAHGIAQHWHFDPRWQPVLKNNRVTVEVAGTMISMQLDPQLRWQLVRGDEHAPLGWYSRQLDQREPCASLVGQGHGSGDVQLQTRIALNNKGSV